MKTRIRASILILPLLFLFLAVAPARATILAQCPEDTDGIDRDGDGIVDNDIVCLHLTAGDGFVKMAQEGGGRDMYVFSFGQVIPLDMAPQEVIANYTLKAMNPAPLITLNQGQELYLTLTNVGMNMRPDLFDDHTVHWHGFPNAAPIFDGVPESSLAPIMGASLTYYYNAVVPGTYFYHCHVEAAEHMQMGMIGNLWVKPYQDQTPGGVGGFTKFAYNDGDGDTGYDKVYPLQLTGYDSAFHEASVSTQPLPFAAMFDDYSMINGRGYPDTVNPGDLINQEGFAAQPAAAGAIEYTGITAQSGQRILLRVSNVSTTHNYTIATTLGVPMRVVGRGAAHLRGPDGKDTSWNVSTLNVAGGQAFDVILETAGIAPGTYFLYTTNLANLSNGPEERGGIMTEIIIQ
jgi:FtsP/CotA-like multicopper oxidase with cupredoxin domain